MKELKAESARAVSDISKSLSDYTPDVNSMLLSLIFRRVLHAASAGDTHVVIAWYDLQEDSCRCIDNNQRKILRNSLRDLGYRVDEVLYDHPGKSERLRLYWNEPYIPLQ